MNTMGVKAIRPWFSLLFLIVSAALFAQSLESELSLQPTLSIPLGPEVDGDLPLFEMGAGVSFKGDLYHSSFSSLYLSPDLALDFLPLNGSDSSIAILAPALSLGLRLTPASRLTLKAYGGGGIYYGMSDFGNVSNPQYYGGAEAALRLSPSFTLGVGGRYRVLTTPSGNLHEGISLSLGVGVDLKAQKKSQGMLIFPSLNPVYPLFYTYYDTNPAGRVSIKNVGSARYENLKVSFHADQYMEGYKLCGEKRTLKPGEEMEVPVYALFKDNIFRVTEGTKVSGEIKMEYDYLGKSFTMTEAVTVEINNRNAMTWDDDRKAAAFVTAKDPVVLSFSKNTVSLIRSGYSAPISENFRTALAVFQTMSVYGLGYAVDPSTPFVDFSSDEAAVDYLQFPNQTLSFRAGDCDDLSVLYAALLESVGVPAAFVTTPGHIYIAFDMNISEKNAQRFFDRERDVIVHEGKVWMPVEITLVKEGFMKAWRTGAQEWYQAQLTGQAALYPVQEAWEIYEPVGFLEAGLAAALPDNRTINNSYTEELDSFYDYIVGPQVARIHGASREKGLSEVETKNRVAVFYAQIGMYDKSEKESREALELERHVPSLVNLGNLMYIDGKQEEALALYQEAYELKPMNTRLLYRIVDLLYSRNEYEEADTMLAQLKEQDPDLAGTVLARYGETGATRASEGNKFTLDDWMEE
ncbi:MAG: tetratricopeptide repeat protein [Spirochaetales bacterium]|nr:tetratricopeptide repeat protein [Spirochaetales bacterium]